MYQVNLGNKILYYPASEDAVIYDTELNEEVGLAGEFTFKVPPQNPLYSELTQGALVTILKDNVEVWRGEIRNIDTDFAKIASVYCLEDLAWLADEYLTPALITNETFAQRFQTVIGAYNASRSAERQFAVGYITNVDSSQNCTWQTEYEESILECLRKCICQAGTTTGYIRVRRVTSGGVVTRYIDIVRLSDYGSQTTQPIEYGYNLLDYVKESDYSNLANVLTPYGDDLDSEVYEGYSAKLQGTTITNTDSVNVYGRHAKAVVFDGVTDVNILNTLAAAYLTRYSQPQLTMEVEAVDLSAVESVDEITIGDSVRIIAQPFAVDQWLFLTQIKRDIQNIDKNSITLSGYVRTGRTITSQALGTAEAVKNLPSKSSILDAAKKNAIEILDGTNGGNIYFVFNEDGQIVEQGFSNNADLSQATAISRWNINGKAILTRETPNDDWTVKVAETIDGGIVADFITTGNLIANNGVFELDMSSGQVTMQNGDFSGKITSTNGAIGGFTITSNSLGTPLGQVGCGMATGGTHGVNLYAWDSDYNCRIYQGKITCSTGSHSGRGIYVYAGADESGHYILHGHSDVYSDQYGGVEWTGSDRNLKKNIEDLTLEKAKELIYGAKARKFDFKAKDGKRYGFIAQELREILDDDSDIEYKSELGDTCNIHYQDFIAPLCMIVKDLQKQINTLKGERNG